MFPQDANSRSKSAEIKKKRLKLINFSQYDLVNRLDLSFYNAHRHEALFYAIWRSFQKKTKEKEIFWIMNFK